MKPQRHQPCGKGRYPTERAAIKIALRSSLRSGTALRVYRCPDCHGWHLTSRKSWAPTPDRQRLPRAVTSTVSTSGAATASEHQDWCTCSRCAWMSEPEQPPVDSVAEHESAHPSRRSVVTSPENSPIVP